MDLLPWGAGLLVGLLIGLLAGLVVRRPSRRVSARRQPPQPGGSGGEPATGTRRSLCDELLEHVQIAAVAVSAAGDVVYGNPAADQLGVVSGGRLDAALREVVRTARRDGEERSSVLRLAGPGLHTPRGLRGPATGVEVAVRARPLAPDLVAVLAEDVTEAQRVESVRRDFVANVSHEIKTPVGALALLSEAALEAGDDAEAARRFLARIRHEAVRLGRLVGELIDLSRLQGGEAPPPRLPVELDAVVREATDRGRPAAEARGITIVSGGEPGGVVLGSEAQLVTAVANLLDNAVAYSDAGTKVAVATRHRGDSRAHWELSVTDQGIGIPADDTGRIFERFYRVDPARSRRTGGTGLGLAIVKHIVTNHGGEVGVWSVPGSGSTFTLRLPAANPQQSARQGPQQSSRQGPQQSPLPAHDQKEQPA